MQTGCYDKESRGFETEEVKSVTRFRRTLQEFGLGQRGNEERKGSFSESVDRICPRLDSQNLFQYICSKWSPILILTGLPEYSSITDNIRLLLNGTPYSYQSPIRRGKKQTMRKRARESFRACQTYGSEF